MDVSFCLCKAVEGKQQTVFIPDCFPSLVQRIHLSSRGLQQLSTAARESMAAMVQVHLAVHPVLFQKAFISWLGHTSAVPGSTTAKRFGKHSETKGSLSLQV